MDHPRIDDEHVVDRYLAGELTSDEEARFEEHLFACEGCLEAVEWGDDLRRGVRAVRTVPRVDAGSETSAAWWPWLGSPGPARIPGLASLGLAVVVLAGVTLWQQTQLHQLRGHATQTAGFTQPIGDFHVVSLGVVRNAAATEIRLDRAKQAVLLSLELPSVGAASYRIVLLDAAGKLVWRGEDVEPSIYDTLMVALPSQHLAAGDYTVTVGALPAPSGEPTTQVELRVLPDR